MPFVPQVLRDLVEEWRSVLRDPTQRATIKRLTEDPEPGQYSGYGQSVTTLFASSAASGPELSTA